MSKPRRSKLLITVVLAAALLAMTGSGVHATGAMRSKFSRTGPSSVSLKTWQRPLAGEPDVGGGTPVPPPKVGNAPRNLRGTDWVLRFYWSLRVMLNQFPRR